MKSVSSVRFRVSSWNCAVRRFRSSAVTPAFICLIALSLVSCSHLHSKAITLQLVNRSGVPINNLAFEFPGGSFGVDTIAPGAMRQKWFKPLSTGPLKVEFDDSAGHHSAQPLTLHDGDSGTVVLAFLGNGQVGIATQP